MFSEIANDVIPGWDISLAFVGSARAKALNKKLRNKDYVPNVLSYALGKKSGEIIICPNEAQKQAHDLKLSTHDFLLLLFIHGLLHLKGWRHSVRMEECEQKLIAKYGSAHSNRHGHGHVPGKNGRRRGTLR